MRNKIKLFKIKSSFFILSTAFSSLGLSEVTLDGSMGSSGALNGPNYQIKQELGRQEGHNLFHSFGRFNLTNTESATFSGSPNIRNVISRVTGGQRSDINGSLNVNIPGANLYLLNPAGIIFGKDATVNVTGAFHASTADVLKFQDGVHLKTGDIATTPILTTAEPEAFGFLDKNPAPIQFTGEKGSVLKVSNGKTLSLTGGDITLEKGSLYAPNGQVYLTSVGSIGDVRITESGLDTSSFEKMGNINLHQANVNVSADTAGKVFIRGGQMVMDNATIKSETTHGWGGNLSIEAASIDLKNSSTIKSTSLGDEGHAGDIEITTHDLKIYSGSNINTNLKKGFGGDMSIKADTVLLDGKGQPVNDEDRTLTGISSAVFGSGNTGNLTLDIKKNFDILNSALILIPNAGSGNSGDLTIKAKEAKILLSGNNISKDLTGIHAESLGKGKPSKVIIESNELIINNAYILATTTSGANNDNTGINIISPIITLSGNNSTISSGAINFDASTSKLNVESVGDNTSNATSINLTATNKLELRDGASIASVTNTNGNAGDITIKTGSLEISNSNINASTTSSGKAGTIEINANDILLNNGGIYANSRTDNINISSSEKGGKDIAMSGNISVTARNSLYLENNSFITVMTTKANAGMIKIDGEGIVKIDRGSKITTSVAKGEGEGGNISIFTPIVSIDGGTILANAIEGMGGNILITGALFQSPLSTISAKSELSKDGEVNLKPSTDISGSVAELPDIIMELPTLLSNQCEARSQTNASSFIIKSDELDLPEPGDLTPSDIIDHKMQKNHSIQKLDLFDKPFYDQEKTNQLPIMAESCIE